MTQINPEALNVASQMLLKEIDLTGTDAERKAKLAQFETDWKALTGASDMKGARFVGNVSVEPSSGDSTLVILNKDTDGAYSGLSMTDTLETVIKKIVINPDTGSLTITPLFSHLEPVEIFDDNSIESKKKNIDNINAYKANLEQLGVDTSISFQIPIYRKSNSGVEESGFLIYSNLPHVYKPYSGLFLDVDETSFSIFGISSTGEFIEQTYYATLEDVQQANTLAQALKDLHTPIAISTLNTTESNAQNVRNIADFVAKAKAAGITDVDGMAVTCLLSSGYSGVGYLHFVDGNYTLQGVEIQEELDHSTCFLVWDDGSYKKTNLITGDVTSQDLTRGARKPIILTSDTAEVDEDTYQKLLTDDVDVMFKNADGKYCVLTYKSEGNDTLDFYLSCFSAEGESSMDVYIHGFEVSITKNSPHTCSISEQINNDFANFLDIAGYLNKSTLSPVLQEIDLTGTDAQRKAELDQFEADWKTLTGASDLSGARFVGKDENFAKCVFTYDANNNAYRGLSSGSEDDEIIRKIYVDCVDGTIIVTPLFSHLSPVEIFTDNSAASKQKNFDNLNVYK